MPRSDRLIDLIQILRDGRLHRARDIARRLGVSLRTVYRDMDTLAASGIPIEGARGEGYRTTAAITLPPLNLTTTELEALHLGLAVIGEAGDEELRGGAQSLSAKIDAVLPQDRTPPPTGFGFATYPFADAAAGFQHMPALRAAIRARQKLRARFPGDGGLETLTLRPLRLDYWGRVWTCIAWVEERADFAELRVDKIENLTVLGSLFVEEPGTTLADFRARQEG